MNGLRTLRKFSRRYRHTRRYREILGILVKNGFGYFFENRRWGFGHRPSGKESLFRDDAAFGRRLVNTLIALGPTFVKFGQMLSCRPDLLPEDLIRALTRLQSEVPPFPYEEAVQTIEKDLGKPLAELFSEFSRIPDGSASIAQGYRAVLKDGRKVFVKVQRPNILPRVRIDLDILAKLAERLENTFPELAGIRPSTIVEDFRDGVLKELNFLNEAANMRAFARQFSGDPEVVIPRPIPGYCTRHILTMDCVDAISFRDMQAIRASGIDCGKIAELGVRLLQHQIFETGFFHGDPHPGNMFVLPGPKIAYIDFGIMGRLTSRERLLLRKIAIAMFWDDMSEMARNLAALSDASEKIDLDALERELGTLVAAHLKGNVYELNVVQFTLDLHQLCYRRRLRMSPHLFRMVRSLGYADAIGRSLAPDFNIMALLRPYVLKQSVAELNPLRKLKNALRNAEEWTELFRHLPRLSRQILEQLKDGTLTVRTEQPDTRKLAEAVRRASRRIADAVIVAALLGTGTVLLIAAERSPATVFPELGTGALIAAGIILLFYFFRKD